MLDYAIAKEELRRLTKGVIPIALILFGALVLLGQPVMQVAAGIVSGTVFALWSFYLMSRSAVRAVWQGDPARASKIITRSYAVRYSMTAVFLIALIWTDWVNIPAAVLTLFSPKITLMILHFLKKGGEL